MQARGAALNAMGKRVIFSHKPVFDFFFAFFEIGKANSRPLNFHLGVPPHVPSPTWRRTRAYGEAGYKWLCRVLPRVRNGFQEERRGGGRRSARIAWHQVLAASADKRIKVTWTGSSKERIDRACRKAGDTAVPQTPRHENLSTAYMH